MHSVGLRGAGVLWKGSVSDKLKAHILKMGARLDWPALPSSFCRSGGVGSAGCDRCSKVEKKDDPFGMKQASVWSGRKASLIAS